MERATVDTYLLALLALLSFSSASQFDEIFSNLLSENGSLSIFISIERNWYKLEELRRGAIVGQKRQGMQWNELEDLEDAMENDVRRRLDENGETE